jgi:hypothetical protein
MEIFPWKLFMYPLKTPGNISMYQGKQMKSSHVSNGKTIWKNYPTSKKLTLFSAPLPAIAW